MNVGELTYFAKLSWIVFGVIAFFAVDSWWAYHSALENERLKRFFDKFRWVDKPLVTEALLFAASYLILFAFNNHKFIYYNNYSWLAESFLNGRLDCPDLPEYLESVALLGKTYMHLAPGPAVVSMPFVAIWGRDFRVEYLCFFLGAMNTVWFYRIVTNLGIGAKRARVWLSLFASFGVVHFWLAAMAQSWFFGQVTGHFFVLAALCLLTVPNVKKPLLVLSGFLFGFAVTCRMSLLFGAVFFVGYIILKKREKRIPDLLSLGAGVIVPAAIYFAFNYARFGTIFDLSYNIVFLNTWRAELDAVQALPADIQLEELRKMIAEHGGPLQLKHIWNNLYSIFILPPKFQAEFPYVIPTMWGVCVTITSPALFFAARPFCRNKGGGGALYLLLATVVITAVPFLLNDHNGYSQFGMRYSMDFTPYLLILAAFGMSKMRWYHRAAICYCFIVNAWGPLYWNTFYALNK